MPDSAPGLTGPPGPPDRPDRAHAHALQFGGAHFAYRDVEVGGHVGRLGVGLSRLRRADAVAELSGPQWHAFEVGPSRRGRGPQPGRSVEVIAWSPVFPGQDLGLARVVDNQLSLGVNGVVAVGEGELEQLGLGYRFGRAGFDAEVAVDAAQEIDLVHETITLPGRHRRIRRVVCPPHVYAPGRAHTGTELATDALLHTVFVAVEHMPAMDAFRLDLLVLGVLGGHLRLHRLLAGDEETLEKRDEPVLVPGAHGVSISDSASSLFCWPTSMARSRTTKAIRLPDRASRP